MEESAVHVEKDGKSASSVHAMHLYTQSYVPCVLQSTQHAAWCATHL